MENKVLFDLICDYVSYDINNDLKQEISDYIMENNISNNDLKKVCLVLLNKGLFDYVSCYNYGKIIENIDNKSFMENEDNFF